MCCFLYKQWQLKLSAPPLPLRTQKMNCSKQKKAETPVDSWGSAYNYFNGNVIYPILLTYQAIIGSLVHKVNQKQLSLDN